MKLLLFSDLHADANAARRLVERSDAADVLVGAGDFGNIRRHVQVYINILRAIDKPAALVASNNGSTAELAEACWDWLQVHVLDGSAVTSAAWSSLAWSEICYFHKSSNGLLQTRVKNHKKWPPCRNTPSGGWSSASRQSEFGAKFGATLMNVSP